MPWVGRQLRQMLDRITPAAPAGDFIDMANRSVFGSPAGLASRRRYVTILEEGSGRVGLLARMLAEPGHAEKVVAELEPEPGLSDEAFVSWAYRTLLEREPDPEGQRACLQALAAGSTRSDTVRGLVRSDEYRRLAVSRYFPLVDLRRLRPERYGRVEAAPVYRAEGPEDFDWIETAILEGGYYDKPGVWGFGIDTDKRLMAELLSTLEPTRVLELGCASGPVLHCLHDMGIEVEGVEISQAAIDSAFPAVQGRIHQVNATDFQLPSSYDVIFGLDIFEHLNPNRLAACLQRVEAHLQSGGYVFCNIPAFGPDPVFGEVFPIYLEPWVADCAQNTLFHTLHVDDLGYPMNGHLIWAHTDWWVQQFEATGLHREKGIEQALRPVRRLPGAPSPRPGNRSTSSPRTPGRPTSPASRRPSGPPARRCWPRRNSGAARGSGRCPRGNRQPGSTTTWTGRRTMPTSRPGAATSKWRRASHWS